MLRAALALVLLAGGVAAAASTVLDARASYPEGPLWRDGRLYVAEMGRDQVSVYAGRAKRVFWRRAGCGPTAIAPYAEGFLILCHRGRRLVEIDARGRDVRDIAQDAEGGDLLDPNDASADAAGGVYVSDPGEFSRTSSVQGSILYVGRDGAARRVARDLWYPNGVYVDPAEPALYVSEHLRGRILRFPIGRDGALGRPEVFARIDFAAPPFARRRDIFAERGPDGLERGPDGRLYVAIYGEGVVLAFGRDGALQGWIETPTRYVTNIAFAPDGAAIVVGAHDNRNPPYPGEVRRWPAASLRGSALQTARP